MTQDTALKALASGANIFLTGEPGAGKTYTFNRFVEQEAKTGQRNIALTASTGIAATHIDGRTIHAWSGIGIEQGYSDAQLVKLLEDDDYLGHRLKKVSTLLIDEVSMLCGESLDDINRLMQIANDTTLSGEPWGGKQVVLGGDFFQLPPVWNKYGGRPRPHFAFESEAWKSAEFDVCYLTEQHRQEDPEFLEILTNLRAGTLTKKNIKRLESRIVKPKTEISTRLLVKNVDVDSYNDGELRKLDGEARTYLMEESGYPGVVTSLKKYCLSPEKLVLKKGALVMFTRNNMDTGYVNGTLGTVVDFTSGGPVVETHDGEIITVVKAEWRRYGDHGNIIGSISQLPLKLAWAMTVHKSQGVSLDSAVIDLRGAFEYGMGYVALSRVRSLDGLYLLGMNDISLKMHPEIVEQDAVLRELSVKTEKKYA